MSDYTLGGLLGLPVQDCEKLLELKSGPAALVYLFVLRHGGQCPRASDLPGLGLTETTLRMAILLLESAGLLRSARLSGGTDPEPAERPVYKADEIARGVGRDQAFAHVLREVERLLGKVLSSSDLQTLYAIYDWRGLPPGVLLLLTHFCVEDSRRRFGEHGRPPTLRQIDREAALWERAGIYTEQAAERHIHWLESRRTNEQKIFSTLGVTGRAPTPSEQKYVEQWLADGFTPETILLAFDKTALATGKLSWKYCAAILSRWKEEGRLTVESAQTQPAKKSASSPESATGTPGARELDSVARVRAIVQKRKEG